MVETIPYELCNSETLERLNYLYQQANVYKTNRHKENYIDFQEPWLAVSFIGNEGFSLLQERDLFNGMGRLCTRFYWPAETSKSLLNKNYKISQGIRPEVNQMICQQIEYGKKIGIENFFISREDKTVSIPKRICEGLNRNTPHKWHTNTTNKFYVTKDSLQWIIYTGNNYLDN